MSIHIVGVIGLVLVFIIGTLRPINLGALALVMTFLVATIFKGEGVREMYSGFPVDLLVLLARRAGVKTLVLTHVLSHIDRPESREQIIREVEQEFSGKVIWGEDLMKLTVTGAGVTVEE